MTTPSSSRRIFEAMLEHLRREGDDLHEVALAQLPGHRAEDAGSARVALRIDQHRSILVEGDVGAVGTPELLLGADDHSLHDLALAHAAARRRLLDGKGDHVADAGVAPMVPALDADAEDLPSAGVVGHPELGLLLDHRGARSRTSSSRQRFVRERGRDSMMRTRSPSCAWFASSWA